MSADQAQFQQLLSSLLSMDNEVRKQAEVSAKYNMKIILCENCQVSTGGTGSNCAIFKCYTHIFVYII